MSKVEVEKRKLKKLNVLNDFVLILTENKHSEFMTDEQKKIVSINKGVVIGYGPDVNGIDIGDSIILRSNRYQTMMPESGVYKNDIIAIATNRDLIINSGKNENYEYDGSLDE